MCRNIDEAIIRMVQPYTIIFISRKQLNNFYDNIIRYEKACCNDKTPGPKEFKMKRVPYQANNII